MKKMIMVAMLMASSVLNAQVIKQNLLNGYAEGDILEKGAYTSKEDAPQEGVWMGAFTSKEESAALPSPTITASVEYAGYPEKGAAIQLGFANGEKGSRHSCCALGENKKKGVYYLSAVVRMDKVGNTGDSELFGLTPARTGGAGKVRAMIVRDEEDKKVMRWGVSLGKKTVMSPQPFAVGETVLVVLKVDYTKNSVSLFVNPDLSAAEPEALVSVNSDEENMLSKWPIRTLTLRNRNAYKGAIGGFRLSNSWEAIGK